MILLSALQCILKVRTHRFKQLAGLPDLISLAVSATTLSGAELIAPAPYIPHTVGVLAEPREFVKIWKPPVGHG